MAKTLKVIPILLAIVLALNFSYVYAQNSYAETLEEVSSRLPDSWHGFGEISKQISGQSFNGIWGKQEGQKYRYIQVGMWQFDSESAIEDSREYYESGQVAQEIAAGVANDVLAGAQTSTSTIAGSKVFNLTSSSAQLQVDLLTISCGIYHDYGIFIWTFDGPKTSAELWAEVASYIGEKSGGSEPPTTPATDTGGTDTSGDVIKSTTGGVGAFAYDWWWSKDRDQDGRYGETQVTIELDNQPVEAATLYVSSGYSQQSGNASVTVYISTAQQVTPPDADHDRDSWWVGNTVTLGQNLGDFTTAYGSYSWSADITSFVNQNKSKNTFYVAFENHAPADVGIGSVYIEATLSAATEPEPEPKPEPEIATGAGEYELVTQIVLAEQELYDAMWQLVVTDADGYLATYSKFFADAVVDYYNTESEGGYLDKAWAYIFGSSTEAQKEETSDEVLDYFINNLWKELKPLLESKVGIKVPAWVDDSIQYAIEHRQEMESLRGTLSGLTEEETVRYGVWFAVYAGMRWGAYGDDLAALEAAYQDFQASFQNADDATVLSLFGGKRSEAESYIALLESQTQQLKDKGIRDYTFKTALLSDNSIGQVIGATLEAGQGIDSWKSRERKVSGYEINKLPRSLMGANYFKSCKNIWSVVDILGKAVPSGDKVSFIVNDIGFNGGYVACLVFANEAMEQDIASMTKLLK